MSLPAELGPESLYTKCDPDAFDFETTDQIKDAPHIVGQTRAIEAVRFGIAIRDRGYNLFALGPAGVGKRFLVRHFLDQEAMTRPAPDETCYINNFSNMFKPRLLRLPAGRGASLKKDLEALVEDVQTALPGAFETEDYQSRLQALQEEMRSRPSRALELIGERAREKGLTMVQTSVGVVIAPAAQGQVMTPEQFEGLPEDERQTMQTHIEELQEELEKVMRTVPRLERELRAKVRELHREVASFAAGQFIQELAEKYADLPAVGEYLADLQNDVTEHAKDFLQLQEGQAAQSPEARLALEAWSRRYQINVLVDNGRLRGAPIVYEDHPTFENLVGRVEYLAQMGALVTDYSLIRPGALHRANGGFLILDARKVLLMPHAWEALKRALFSQQIRIESPTKAQGAMSTISLEPEPAPLNVKVILIGDRSLYYLLAAADPDFPQLFKVSADFDDDLERNDQSHQQYAKLISALIRNRNFLPLDRYAVARVIEHSARMANDAERLSLDFEQVIDLLREASYWAGKEGKSTVGSGDVQRALDARIFRSDRISELMRSNILRDTIYIDTDGKKVGQVNGLSVYQIGSFPFGRPVRITARVRPGKGEVIDIEREVELGGPLHSKGVLILSGFLGARYAGDHPLGLSATLVFEQSYSGIEGDSASSTELYALLSAIADVPIRQSLAVTGSVNQHGEVQPIGGVNEKIEGFFDICSKRGLTGDQGVLIPASNVKHLMLRRDVIDAVRHRKFHIHPVRTVDEGIEILTGIASGVRSNAGVYPENTIGGIVQARLRDMARGQVAFAKAASKDLL